MFGPHAIGSERFAMVSSGRSFAQVAAGILQRQARVQNPDKDEVQRLVLGMVSTSVGTGRASTDGPGRPSTPPSPLH
jgi:hypothetical protein